MSATAITEIASAKAFVGTGGSLRIASHDVIIVAANNQALVDVFMDLGFDLPDPTKFRRVIVCGSPDQEEES